VEFSSMTMRFRCSHSIMLQHFNWELFDHPSYSSDLPSSDYRLLAYLMNWLVSQRLNNNEELMEGVKTWLSSAAISLWHRHTKTYSPIRQVSQFQRGLCWDTA
jgi:hypothetical protein